MTQPRTGPTLTERVAEEIRVLLARRRMSQAELARQLNVSGAWLNYRLTGKQPIDLNDLDSIAAALGVKPGDLLGSAGSTGATVRYPNDTGKRQAKAPKTAPRPDTPQRTTRPPSYPHAARRPQILGRHANG